jgi:hypothetical protein
VGKGERIKSNLASAVPAQSPFRPLSGIFDLHQNVFGLILAAGFGLTPGLLFTKLQQQSEKVKDELKGSEVTQASHSRAQWPNRSIFKGGQAPSDASGSLGCYSRLKRHAWRGA